RSGTRSFGWTRPASKTLREAGSESETTVSGTAFIVEAPRAVGPRKIQREPSSESGLKELSYASMNWIRFGGSPRRAVSAPLASQPLAGAPLVTALTIVRRRRQVNADRRRQAGPSSCTTTRFLPRHLAS